MSIVGGCLGIKTDGAWVVLIHRTDTHAFSHPDEHQWLWAVGAWMVEKRVATEADTITHASCEQHEIATVDQCPVVIDERVAQIFMSRLPPELQERPTT